MTRLYKISYKQGTLKRMGKTNLFAFFLLIVSLIFSASSFKLSPPNAVIHFTRDIDGRRSPQQQLPQQYYPPQPRPYSSYPQQQYQHYPQQPYPQDPPPYAPIHDVIDLILDLAALSQRQFYPILPTSATPKTVKHVATAATTTTTKDFGSTFEDNNVYNYL